MNEIKKYKDTEWLYATARVRALERRLPDAAALDRLVDARDAAEVCAICTENGLALDVSDTEAGLRAFIAEVYDEMTKTAPDPKLLDIMRLPNDAHNVKTAIKCSIVSRDPIRLMLDTGTIAPAKAAECINERKFDIFPKNIAHAIPEAFDVWARTRDPQSIDQLIDDACARDRAALAKAYDNDFMRGLVEYECDLSNILTCVRIIRMTGEGADIDYLARMLQPCGSLGFDFFTTSYSDGETALWAKLAATRYSDLPAKLDAQGKYTLTAIERIMDDIRIGYMKNARFILAGAPALIAYIYASELYVKNVRIILASKEAGESGDIIRERLRGTYV